jgi:nucleoside-diphosphate-sugar epimerase
MIGNRSRLESATAERLPIPDWCRALANKRMLVTGAAGFIGGALFRRLRSYGCDVKGTVLHRHEAEAIYNGGGKAEVLDLTADETFDQRLRDIDIVFHLAALFQETGHREAVYREINTTGALKMCQAAAAAGVERFVHCSTVGVHGDVREVPCKETSPFNPMDRYQRTKLAGELAVLEFARALPADGMVVTVNRPAIVYGPGDLRMLKLFKAILRRRFVMIGSGEVKAHLCYIEDQIDSLILCAVAPRAQVHLEAFNIASDQPITLNELARLVASHGKVAVPRWHFPVFPVWLASVACEAIWAPFNAPPPLFRRRVGFFTRNRAFDVSKANARLGYVSQWDNRTGIANTIDWYRSMKLV